jgi:hypothetical protein
MGKSIQKKPVIGFVEPMPKKFEIITNVIVAWGSRIQYGKCSEEDAYSLIRFLVGLDKYCDDNEKKAYLLANYYYLINNKLLRDLIHRKHHLVVKESANEDYKKVISWVDKHIKYLYFHPKERTFKLDELALEENISTCEFRKKNPWGINEGPNKVDPERIPRR